jgi:hypothetical protein
MEKQKKSMIYRGMMLVLFVWMLGLLVGWQRENVQAADLAGVTNLHQTEAKVDSFKVEWDKDSNAAGYEIQYSADGNNWSSGSYTQSLSYTISDLNSGRSYYVKMRSYDLYNWYTSRPSDGANYSEWSDAIEVITAPKMVSSGEVKQTAGTEKSITVSWEAADGATKYEVYYATGSNWFSAGETTETSFTIKGLEQGTGYKVSIKAIREASTGFSKGYYYTDPVHSCYTTSSKVKNLSLKKWDTGTNKVTLEWDDVSGKHDGYEVYVTNLSGKKIKKFKTTGNPASFKNSSVKNKGFIYKVRAYFDIDGTTIYGKWSSSMTIIAQPKVTLKKSSSTSITVSWAKVAGASSYTVYRSTGSGTDFTKLKTTSKTKLTNKGLNSFATYYYYVVANGVSVGKKTYKSTTATNREIAYLNYKGKTVYTH